MLPIQLANSVHASSCRKGQIYLDWQLVRPLCADAERTLLEVLDGWKRGGIGGWLGGDSPWFTMAESLAARVAKLSARKRMRWRSRTR
jgi:kynureninase